MILADKIIRLRKKNGWSQEELAEKINVSRQAVSKWEGAQTVPDLDKILQLSSLFGVTTDYLLKDEIENEEFTDGTVQGVKRVTMTEANEYLDYRKKASYLIGLGVLLCITSPCALIILSAAPFFYSISPGLSVLIGIAVLLIFVAAAVGLFSFCGFRSAAYSYLSKEFETEYGVNGMVKERDNKFRPFGIASNIIATCLCVLSPLPIIASAFLGNAFVICISVAVSLLLIGIGVMLYIVGTVQSVSMHRLLKDNTPPDEEKQNDKPGINFPAVYWLCATAIYLIASFITGSWGFTWVIWPIAGVLYPLSKMIYNKVISK
ncbi:MAG: helix-turn-helix transcriptional regulator [Clostridia bacterium]|nr:helix-turn-helix transcriptional regulator [Clostridia bacterium]